MRRETESPLRGIRRLLASFAALCLVGCQGIVNAQPFEVTLWVDHKRATKSSLKKSVQEHPCGAVVTKRLSQIPLYRASAIVQPDRAVEFSASGQILTVWAIPVDMSVVGVWRFDFGGRSGPHSRDRQRTPYQTSNRNFGTDWRPSEMSSEESFRQI